MARPKHSGYEPIIRVLAALPGTDTQVHERTGGGIPMQTVTDWLRSAVRTGIARIERIEHVGPRLFARHYALGSGPSAIWQHASRDGGRSHTTVIALATLFDALRSGPMLVADLVDETGMDRRVLHRTLDLLRQHDLARVAQWPRDAYGRPAAAWSLGSEPDARKPRPTPRKVVNARAWARRRAKLQQRQVIAALTGAPPPRDRRVSADGCGRMVARMVAGG